MIKYNWFLSLKNIENLQVIFCRLIFATEFVANLIKNDALFVCLRVFLQFASRANEGKKSVSIGDRRKKKQFS